MATNLEINVTVKTTWVKPIVLFICRYVKKKWILKLLRNLTVAKVYMNGRLQAKVKLSAIIWDI